MARKIAYWTSTAIVALMLLMALTYLTGSEQLLALLVVSYVTRPASRRLMSLPASA